jgi:hypothetical protein
MILYGELTKDRFGRLCVERDVGLAGMAIDRTTQPHLHTTLHTALRSLN